MYQTKEKGGLGIINLRSQNAALLIKHLDKFYNKKDIPWVSDFKSSGRARGTTSRLIVIRTTTRTISRGAL
jgi:hypothetical protein